MADPNPCMLRKVAEISALKATLAQTEAEGQENWIQNRLSNKTFNFLGRKIQFTPFSQRKTLQNEGPWRFQHRLPVGEETLRLRGSGPELTAAELLATEAERLEEAGPEGEIDMLGVLMGFGDWIDIIYF